MLPATIIFGPPGAGKSALARSLIHDFSAPPAAWFASDDRTLNFDATCLDLSRSNWSTQRMIWLRNGSCFVFNLDLSDERLDQLVASGIERVFVLCSGDPSEMRVRLSLTGAIVPAKAVLVLDAARMICELGALESKTLPGNVVDLLLHADEVVLSKRDLVAKREVDRLVAKLVEARGADIPIVEAKFGRIQSASRSGRLPISLAPIENRV